MVEKKGFVQLLAVCALTLTGCSTFTGVFPSEAERSGDSLSAQPLSSSVLIKTGDKLLIDVPQAERFNGIVAVSPSGTITHPVLEPLTIAGLDLQSAGQAISDAIAAKRQIQPRVRLSVLNYPPITLSGEVVNSGQYPYILGLNLAQVLEEAGGLTYRADRSRAFVRGFKSGAKREVRISLATKLKPGDHIMIPQRYFD